MELMVRALRWGRLWALFATVGFVHFAAVRDASAEDYMAMENFQGKRISVDGMLREWPRHLDVLKAVQGPPSKHRALVGYDDAYLYLAADLSDANIVRTQAGGQGEDRLVLSLLVPSLANGAPKRHEIEVLPGVPGKMAALVKVDGRKDDKSRAVEAPRPGGYSIEARIPWSSLSGTTQVRVGLRGVVSYHDASSVGRVQSVSRSSSTSGSTMPPLATAPETGLIQSLLRPKELPLLPAREAYADLTGKGGAEKVALHGHFLAIVGPGYQGGRQFYFNELDVADASQVTELTLVDFNGDARAEIVLRKRLGKPQAYREVIQVLQLGPNEAPVQVFVHETAIVTEDGRAENDVKIQGQGSSARIVISQGRSSGFDPDSYREPTLGAGIESALLPWQTVKSKTYGWKGAGLALIAEETWKPTMQTTTTTSTVSAPPPPRAPTSDELLDRVYALYKSDRGVAANSRARFDFVTDVSEDGQMERVLVHGRDLVVFGKGFKNALSYTYLSIGVKEPDDVLAITTRDLVGDGKAEIIVHAVLRAQASESLGGDVVQRQALLVYKVVGESLQRIFAAETGRALGANRVLGAIAFLPHAAGVRIELRPNRSLGWSERNYPFPQDQHPAGGLEPLLLPWSGLAARRYSFDGSRFVQN